MYTLDKLCFTDTALFGELWRYAGNDTGIGLRQIICWRFAIKNRRLTDNIKIGIGSESCKLRGSITLWIDTESFVIMPVKGLCVMTGHCHLD
jgi:hypothetical protein